MTHKIFELSGAKINYKGQGTCLIALPDGITPKKAVIAVHGSGRGAFDYLDEPFYKRQLEISLRNGCLFACVSNVRDTWGTDDGLYNLVLLIDHLKANYNMDKVILWSTSAGGTLANRLVAEHPELVEMVIGTFPVYDLVSGFLVLDSCKTAWKTTDFDEFKQKIQGKNPADFPDKLTHCKYFIAHGSADSAVPINEHSLRLKQDLGENVMLEIIENGEHETSNFAYYGKAVAKAFGDVKILQNAKSRENKKNTY